MTEVLLSEETEELIYDEDLPRDAFLAYIQIIGEPDAADAVEPFRDAYQGEYESLTDYAENYLGETGQLDSLPDWARRYFNYESYGRDLELGGDVWTHETGNWTIWVFITN